MTAAATIAQVVPAIPSFSVDDGFSYAIPEDADVSIGSIVRVPLGGRRVRGYVTGTRRGDASNLKPLLRVSAPVPVFDSRLLETLRGLAVYYVAPQAVILAKAAPPNLPRPMSGPKLRRLDPVRSGVLPDLVAALAQGG